MSLIDENKRKAIQKFFEEVLCPVSQRLRERSLEFFPMRPDPNQISYYQDCIPQQMEPDQFDLKAASTPSDFIAHLTALWNQQDLPELAELTPKLLVLMSELLQDEEPNSDLPPFTYTLF